MTLHFNDANFQEEVLNKSKTKPVLVDFFAAWCGPCRMQAPVIDKLAEEIGDKAAVGKLDTEESQQTAMQYGIMSIPTMIVFRNGEVKETLVGMQPKDFLADLLKKYF